MHKIIKDNLDELNKLCAKYDVKSMYIFGSVLKRDFNQDSDIDILVDFKELSIEQYTDNYFDLHHDLEKLLGRKIDLITERSLTNPYLIKSIEESRQLLYAA